MEGSVGAEEEGRGEGRDEEVGGIPWAELMRRTLVMTAFGEATKALPEAAESWRDPRGTTTGEAGGSEGFMLLELSPCP